MHLRSTRFQGAFDALDVKALVQRLHKDFCLCCCPVRICRHNNATKGLQELSKSEELLSHTHKASVSLPDQTLISIFKKHQGQFSSHGLTLIGPILSPSKGLVLCNIEDH